MIWLTWRQLRVPAAAVFAALAALVAVLALTGPELSDDYATGMASCAQSGTCSEFIEQFFNDHQTRFLAVTAVMLVLPAVVGLFWGAPLIARELEAGTHRLVWNQSVTRTRWLAVKLGLTGLAVAAVAGLGSLAVTWWADPIDKSAADLPRMAPLVFDARGIVPIGYAAFAFALGVAAGMLVHRTLAAMAITLVVFVAVQAAVPLLVRPHLVSPVESTVEITEQRLDMLGVSGTGVDVRARSPEGAWLLSDDTVDASGRPVGSIPLPSSGACGERAGPDACLAELNRLGYRFELTYQPASRFWTFQWIETGIFTALTAGLTGFCFWQLRRRRSF